MGQKTGLLKLALALIFSRFKKNHIPEKIQLVITEKCNLKCKYCSMWQTKHSLNDEIDIDVYDKIFKDFNGNLKWLAITGGEPCLKKNIVEIVRRAKFYNKKLFFVSINSNGFLPERLLEIATKVKEIVPNLKIMLSIDGDENYHNSIRGSALSYKKVLKSYELLQKAQIDAEFEYTVHLENCDHTIDFFNSFQYSKAIKVITFTNINDNYFGNSHQSLKDDLEKEKEKFIEVLTFLRKNHKIKSPEDILIKLHLLFSRFFLRKNKVPISCSAGLNVISIDPFGIVTPCLFIKTDFNIKNNSIKEIVSSKEWKNLYKDIKHHKCPKCWMNCYSLTSIVTYPGQTLKRIFFH